MTRAPLFFVGLAFASGCLLALDHLVSVWAGLIVLVVAGMIWWGTGRHEKVSLAAFYALTASAGLVHTLLLASTIAPDDVRRLPEEKRWATTQWRGVVAEEPAANARAAPSTRAPDRTSVTLRMEAWRPVQGQLFGAKIEEPWRSARGLVSCTFLGPVNDLGYGDRIEAAMGVTPIPAALVPGALDFRAYEDARRVYEEGTVSPLAWRRVEQGKGNAWRALSLRARDWAYQKLHAGLEDDPRMADFLAGMLIGYRQEIPVEIENDFRRTGTLHVFAVSGQNIAEMLMVAMVLLQLAGLVRWRWAWILIPLVLLYCLLTGSPASAVRATVMAVGILLAWRLGRPLPALACWSLAFLAMMIHDPRILLDPGAQLSFGVVLGLIVAAPPLARFLARAITCDPFLPRSLLSPWQRREEKAGFWLMALLASALVATVVSEPITALAFHQVTPISFLANLFVVPMAGLITVVGTLGLTAALFSSWLAGLFNNANWLFAKGLIVLVGFLAHEPGASINVPDGRARMKPAPTWVIAPLSGSASLFLHTREQMWLFNAGRESQARAVTSRLLQFYGVNRLDGLVLAQLSGPDNDGAAILVEGFQPRHLAVPALKTRSPLEKKLPGMAASAGEAWQQWKRGDAFELGSGVRLEVLAPAVGSLETRAENRGLVLLFRAGPARLLWAGKIDRAAQEKLAADYPGLKAEVLVLGIDSQPSEEWLQRLGIKEWLQIPPRDGKLNQAADLRAVSSTSCRAWPLLETGAVTIQVTPATVSQAAALELRPWVKLPP